jgi:hypothetical protein
MLLPDFSFGSDSVVLAALAYLFVWFNKRLQWRFFCFLDAFVHLTLKLYQVKHSSYTYIGNVVLDQSRKLNPGICASTLSRDACNAAIASKL